MVLRILPQTERGRCTAYTFETRARGFCSPAVSSAVSLFLGTQGKSSENALCGSYEVSCSKEGG